MPIKLAQIRPGRPSDALPLAEVYDEAWRNAYQGIIPHLPLERMISRRGLDWWRAALRSDDGLLVLDFAGKARGYVTFGRCRSRRLPAQGEIFELYVHPVYQGIGLGTRLFTAARRKLAEHRLAGLGVWALADNEAACGFYSRRGGRPSAETAERFADVSLPKIGFLWR